MKANISLLRRITVIILLAICSLAISSFAYSGSGEQDTQEVTQVYTVEKMTCGTCPITVKTAMKGLEGVISVAVDLDSETATVVFNPALVTIEAIAAASTDIGFPAFAVK